MFNIQFNFVSSSWMYTTDDPDGVLHVIRTWSKEAAARVANFWGSLPSTIEGDDEVVIRKMKDVAFAHIQQQTIFELCDVCDWALIDTDKNVHDGWCAEQLAREEEAFEELVEDSIVYADDFDDDDERCPKCGKHTCVCYDEDDVPSYGEVLSSAYRHYGNMEQAKEAVRDDPGSFI